MEKPKKLIFKIIYLILILLSFSILLCSGSKYFVSLKDKQEIAIKRQEQIELINAISQNEEGPLPVNGANHQAFKVTDLASLRKYYSNPDIVGTLKIIGTDIQTILVQTVNNEYYLKRSLTKKRDSRGAVFVDYRTPLNSKQVNIYGHNSRVHDIPFRGLKKYLDKQYFDQHRFIEIWDGNRISTYEIFSVQIVKDDYEYLVVNPQNWSTHLTKLQESIYETNVNVNATDTILVIQTCNYNPKNTFLVINSKKIKEVLK